MLQNLQPMYSFYADHLDKDQLEIVRHDGISIYEIAISNICFCWLFVEI